MDAITRSMVIFILSPMLTGFLSCTPSGPPRGNYTINTFEFVHSNPPQNVGEVIPNIWIDTNLKLSSLHGGTLTSSLPCAVKIDYTDNGYAFQNAELTSLKITYDDDAVDPSTTTVKMPLRIPARTYETVNSMAGGRIVRSKAWIISGTIPNMITRAEPFRLQIEGYFTKDDGSRLPFSMNQHFQLKTDNSVKTAAEVLQDK